MSASFYFCSMKLKVVYHLISGLILISLSILLVVFKDQSDLIGHLTVNPLYLAVVLFIWGVFRLIIYRLKRNKEKIDNEN